MEILIFLIKIFIQFIYLFAVPVFVLLMAYLLGKRLNKFHLDKILPLGLIIGSLSWYNFIYKNFTDLCNTLPRQTFYSSPDTKPDGFMVHSLETRSIPGNFNGYSALKSGQFQWMELRDRDMKRIRTEYYDGDTEYAELKDGLKSTYVFTVYPMKPIENNIFSPIYTYTFNLKRVGNDKVLAESTELIFGGGTLGKFLRFMGGDQDYTYRSCGHVSKEIGPWRPTLSTRPRHKDYEIADKNFIIKALTLNKE